MNTNYPFEKGTPSVFAIVSPFQALCAVEAIKDLEIKDYKVFLCLKGSSRDNQTIEILNKYDIKFEIVDTNKQILPFIKRLQIIFSTKKIYRRAFSGSHTSLYLYFWLLRNISDKSCIISLDDGNVNISVLKGTYNRRKKNKLSFLNNLVYSFACKRRKIISHKHFYTIYSDIDNNNYITAQNNLSHILSGGTAPERNCVYFVGSNPESLWKALNITKDEYITLIENRLHLLKDEYPHHKIVYIPHGMDGNDLMESFCQEQGIEYIRPISTIELFMIDYDKNPHYICGFTSSALLNLKLIYKKCIVENFLLVKDYPVKLEYEEISKYYEDKGIKKIRIPYKEGRIIEIKK